MSKSIGVIADGFGDFASVNARFGSKCRVMKTDGPRGDSPTPEQVTRGAAKQICLLQAFGCKTIVLMLDLEERSMSWTNFTNALVRCFSRTDYGPVVKVVVANRMIENWYLADIAYLSRKKAYIREHLQQKKYEGRHGKRVLKALFRPGQSYLETKHGPDMFKTIRLGIAGDNSPSLKCFLFAIGEPTGGVASGG